MTLLDQDRTEKKKDKNAKVETSEIKTRYILKPVIINQGGKKVVNKT